MDYDRKSATGTTEPSLGVETSDDKGNDTPPVGEKFSEKNVGEHDPTARVKVSSEGAADDVEASAAPVALTEQSQFVEGGFHGWSTVAGACLFQFCGFGYAYAFGVYQDFYVREYLTHFSSSQISWIGSTQTFLIMSMGIVSGRLFDRGYFYHVVISGGALIVFSLFMLSLTKPEKFYQIFLAQGLGVGLGAGLTYIPTLAVSAQHFRSQHLRPRAMGLVAAGSSLGGLLHPIMLNNLFHGKAGFAKGVRASAGLILGLQVVALALVRTKYPKPGQNPVKHLKLGHALVKFSKDWAYVCVVISMFVGVQGIFFPFFYLQLDAIERGLDSTFSFYSLSILNGASVIGRSVAGVFSHRIGVINMLLVLGECSGILIFSMLAVKTVGGVAAFAALYGLVSGSYFTLLGPMLAMLADDHSEIGARLGVCFAITGLGSLIASPISGALLTERFIWWRPIIYSATMLVAGTAFLIITRSVLVRRRKTGSWVV